MACEVEYKVKSILYYRLCDQRIQCLQGCLGKLTTSEKCCNVDVHVMTQPSQSFGLLGQAVKQKIHRIKKSQARNCDMCSELKQKC